jgi:5-methylcytosine-specific restriction endonuclease McrA
MALVAPTSPMIKRSTPDCSKLDRVVAEARRQRELRDAGYRERALKLFPRICARCGREFAGERLRELTVHHKDHNHDNNPADGSNWELLCIYCHENEHARVLDESVRGRSIEGRAVATHNPFAELRALLKKQSD